MRSAPYHLRYWLSRTPMATRRWTCPWYVTLMWTAIVALLVAYESRSVYCLIVALVIVGLAAEGALDRLIRGTGKEACDA